MRNIDTSFFKIITEKMPVKSGTLLIAEPFLGETWFNRSVVSLIDHSDKDGTTGVVLNHPIVSTLNEVLDGVSDKYPIKVYCGGPLGQDRLYFVHTLGDKVIPNARCYAPGLWLGGDFGAAISYINEGYPTDGLIRFFIGYSGWVAGQLAGEITENTWAIQDDVEAVPNILEGDGDAYWHKVVRTLGRHYRLWQLLPKDVKWN